MRNPFRYFNSSPEVILLTVMMYIRYPLSLRQVEDLLFERGIDICHMADRAIGCLRPGAKPQQQIFDLPQRKRIADVHHHREADDLG